MRSIIILVGMVALGVLCANIVRGQEGADGYEYVYEDELEEGPADGYEYVYEDEIDDSGSVEVHSDGSVSNTFTPEAEKKPAFKGYYTNVGGGLIRIRKKLVDDVYINETAEYYDCVKRIDSGILALDIIEDEEEDEEEVLQTQIKDLRRKLDEVTAAAAPGGAGGDPEDANADMTEQENITETLKQTELKAS